MIRGLRVAVDANRRDPWDEIFAYEDEVAVQLGLVGFSFLIDA